MAPHTIILYGFAKETNTPSLSGFCQKLETFFRAVGFTNYEHSFTLPQRAPKGKLPYIELVSTDPAPSSTTIADSQLIIQHLVSSGICPDLDAPLTQVERADSRAWISYTEELFYTALVTTRWYWGREDNYAANATSILAPWAIKPILTWYIRRQINGTMWTMGPGRHSTEVVDGIVKEWIDAAEVKLKASSEKGSGWWFGKEEPTLVDVVIYGFLANIIGVGQGNREALGMIKEREAIMAFVKLGTQRFP